VLYSVRWFVPVLFNDATYSLQGLEQGHGLKAKASAKYSELVLKDR